MGGLGGGEGGCGDMGGSGGSGGNGGGASQTRKTFESPANKKLRPVRPKIMFVKRSLTWSTFTKSKEIDACFCLSFRSSGVTGLGTVQVIPCLPSQL